MSSGPPADQDTLIAELAGLTGLPPAEAEQYLNAARGDLQSAASLFFDGSGPPGEESDEDDEDEDAAMADDQATPPQAAAAAPQQTGGGRTLDGAYVPAESSSAAAKPAARAKKPVQRGGPRTIKDLQGDGDDHGHDDDDDENDKDRDFFTGGEKSGLAVKDPTRGERGNPQDRIFNMLKRAQQQNAPRPGGEDEPPEPTHFRGAGTTLGGDDAPSRTIPDPLADVPTPAPRVRRVLSLWLDGFSVDDGPLYRYDDPANDRTMDLINTGHAPLHILNVEPGQEVDVEVVQHKQEPFKQQKKRWVPFGGSGQRLGSPTPGATFSAPSAPAATSSATTTSTSTGPAQPSVQIDDAVPTITLQIRLGDGTRLQSRFNTTHTVGDVYGFVDASSPASRTREYALMTTFPSKELSDKAQALGDMAEFKRGGVVVQKWK